MKTFLPSCQIQFGQVRTKRVRLVVVSLDSSVKNLDGADIFTRRQNISKSLKDNEINVLR